MAITRGQLPALATLAGIKAPNLQLYLSPNRATSPRGDKAKTLAEITGSDPAIWAKGGSIMDRRAAVEAWAKTVSPETFARPRKTRSDKKQKPDKPKKPFTGRKLRLVRNAQGFSSKAFAEKIGIRPTCLGLYELGRVDGSIKIWVQMAKALNTTIDHIWQTVDAAEAQILAEAELQAVADTEIEPNAEAEPGLEPGPETAAPATEPEPSLIEETE
jgi:DNA-binding XRE family transcriptional regulator